MPLDPTTTTPLFLAHLVASPMFGPSLTQLATGLANGLFLYSKGGLTVSTVDAGVAGVGAGLGKVLLTPATATPAIIGSFLAHSIVGPFSILTATAISLAMCEALALAVATTTSPSVGTGAGAGVCVPNSASSVASFIEGLSSAGLGGNQMANFATAVANGLDICLPTAVVVVGITGSGSLVPSGGIGTGVLQ